MEAIKPMGGTRSHSNRRAYPVRFAFTLLTPLRQFLLPPRELARRLELREDSVVLEVGCGPGYFSLEVARRIPRGRLLLVDLQQGMLEMAMQRVARVGLINVECLRADAVALPLDAGSFDVVFLVWVLGEVTDVPACLREARRVLKPGGLLSITEQSVTPDFVPLTALHEYTGQVGFTFERAHGGRKNFTANFRSPTAECRGPSLKPIEAPGR